MSELMDLFLEATDKPKKSDKPGTARIKVKGHIIGIGRIDTPWGEVPRIHVKPLEPLDLLNGKDSFWVTCPNEWAGKDKEAEKAKDLKQRGIIVFLTVTFNADGKATNPKVN